MADLRIAGLQHEVVEYEELLLPLIGTHHNREAATGQGSRQCTRVRHR